ncbi:SCO family protein [Paenactinomyces guangxiensis]|uniref:SCO family protein n=1 Tax=Paenactinomyces guangxiensis TaxID=1490290 RepID=A0A7W2AAQ8_9BACL|nr:SCO family protein [Paenactinomyces guangxiensis]MBA4496143.1 SCO family protein [Paenactinomyces guangxiensis]MBH8593231.1 SCO family protein [Paenactinomyces guangxiensis]
MRYRVRKIVIGLAALMLAVAGCSTSTEEKAPNQAAANSSPQSINDVSDLNWKVPDFTFTDQNGKSFGLKDLKGKVWLADFIFTRCPNVCPPMTANMAKVQKHLNQSGVDVSFVSFSVDPDYDKPAVLKKFAEEHNAILQNWTFLTGYKLEEIQPIAKETFKGNIIHQKGPSPDVPVLVNHPTQFYLIDGTGKVVKFYDGLKPNPEQILKDVKELQKK